MVGAQRLDAEHLVCAAGEEHGGGRADDGERQEPPAHPPAGVFRRLRAPIGVHDPLPYPPLPGAGRRTPRAPRHRANRIQATPRPVAKATQSGSRLRDDRPPGPPAGSLGQRAGRGRR